TTVVEAVRRFDRAWPNLQVGLVWTKQQAGDEESLRLCVRFPLRASYLLSLRRHPQEQIAWWEAACAAARALGDRMSEGAALGNLGIAYKARGQLQHAIELYHQRLALAREVGDRRGEGNALGSLGNAYATQGQPQRAIDTYQQGLAIARE